MSNYILKERKAVKCPDLFEWAQWFECTDRRVAETQQGDVRISTVFLGLDHNDGPPLLFETMVFGGEYDEDCHRYSTWEQAEAGHKTVCTLVFGS